MDCVDPTTHVNRLRDAVVFDSNAYFWKEGSRVVVQEFHEQAPLNEQCYPGGFTYSWRLFVPENHNARRNEPNLSLTVEIFRFFVPATTTKKKQHRTAPLQPVVARGLNRTLQMPHVNVTTQSYGNRNHPTSTTTTPQPYTTEIVQHPLYKSQQVYQQQHQHQQDHHQQQHQQRQQHYEQQHQQHHSQQQEGILRIEQHRQLRSHYEEQRNTNSYVEQPPYDRMLSSVADPPTPPKRNTQRGGKGVRGVLGIGGGVAGYHDINDGSSDAAGYHDINDGSSSDAAIHTTSSHSKLKNNGGRQRQRVRWNSDQTTTHDDVHYNPIAKQRMEMREPYVEPRYISSIPDGSNRFRSTATGPYDRSPLR